LHETLVNIEAAFEEFYPLAAKYNQQQGEVEASFLLERTAKQLRSLWKNANHRIQGGGVDVSGTG